MSDLLPLSVHILTRNSGATLRDALQSLPPNCEILVVDGGSTDDTLAIARSFGARILSQGREGSGPNGISDFSIVRNIPLRQTRQPWILALDSDEKLSPQLRDELTTLIRSNPPPAAYLVTRKYTDETGAVIEQASTYPNHRLYFFHRAVAECWIKPVHERIQLVHGAPIKHLKYSCLTPMTSAEYFRRQMSHYLAIETQRWKGRGWKDWFRWILLRVIRSRGIATVRLMNIWLIPRRGKRLPLIQEWLHFRYAFLLLFVTSPPYTRRVAGRAIDNT